MADGPYRDSRGRTLEEYPRPSVAVDTALLTVTDGQLCVLLTLTNDAVRGGAEEWRLPGSFLHDGETLAEAVLRSLREKAGVDGIRPRQLHVFDAVDRDDRGRVVSVAHLDVARADRLAASDRTRLVPLGDLPHLKYDHDDIVAFAVAALRADYTRMPDPARLLDEPFTMRELRELHEAVLGERLLPDTFRRSMLDGLESTGEFSRAGRGRPAELYRSR
ncbi:NUDIX hydrolase [Microbacterium hominis]|uniref:NUDIX hydrolase n=1 Tax=Microbacterium hominis TaxID=162426 RepID=A0A7D4UHJ5_9MICO|nr:NUDIX domain-containing protein [Microbacterium hominis]QKJ18588.1 NUDIX hydrolase [Microbacterium hominis]